jgi:RNA polymerase sigma factor (sigma-70 family)
MPLSDKELIHRIRAGGEGHRYSVLMDRYKDASFTLAVRMLHSREDAEEAVQDAFIRAYRSLDSFEERSKFSTWLYRIVYNVCLTRLERRGKTEHVSFDEGIEHEDAFLNQSVPHDYERTDLLAFIKATIDTMPAKYATVLTLFYLQDMMLDEIAEITQLPPGTVKVQLHRARGFLKKILQQEFNREGAAA